MDLARVNSSAASSADWSRLGPSRDSASADRVDLTGPNGSSRPYIIMPPEEDIFKGSKIQLVDLGIKVKDELPLIGGYTAELSDKQVKDLERRGYRVHLDEQDRFLPPMPWDPKPDEEDEVEAKKPEVPAQEPEFKTRIPQLAPRFDTPLTRKFQGEGVGIAVLDTGIYPHPDFTTPFNRIAAFVDVVNGRSLPYDDNGHGTHVAGDAAGSGLMSGGIYRGSASKAHLVGVKVLGEDGSGKTSDIIKGLQFCIENKDRLKIRVINLSLGHKARKKYADDPVDQAVKKAYEAGLVVVAAAGNDGPDRKTIKAPGDSPFVITVGAVDDQNTPDPGDDQVTEFSSRGPTLYGAQKPDIVAPGEAIMAPLSPATGAEARAQRFELVHQTLQWLSSLKPEDLAKVPDQQFTLMGIGPETLGKIRESAESARNEFNRLLRTTSRMPLSPNKAYVGMPGTSMATPIVAGVVAAMLEANPDLGPDEVKDILKRTADPLSGRMSKNHQGAGMVDPHEAILAALDRGKPAAANTDILKMLEEARQKPAPDAAAPAPEAPAPEPPSEAPEPQD
ncbi:MAG: S8 family peptidase [Candidatus Eremiobacterota bacterium]